MNEEQVYASVDLELSGFDPETDEIIEIGIQRFAVRSGKLTSIDAWGTLVRPTSEIRTRVLGLTGISSAEASAAPEWSEVKNAVQQLLGDAVILGHGVDLDRKFLEAKGVTLKSETIDTLELAQIFLPTHHSYNLENLAHELAVVHTTAHRALADAEATYGVLEQLIGVYQGLPQHLQKTIQEIASARIMPWVSLFCAVTARIAPRMSHSPNAQHAPRQVVSIPRGSGLVVTALAARAMPSIESMRTNIPTWVVAFAERERVLGFARSESVDPYLGAFESVSKRALDDLYGRLVELGPREVTAFLKVLVWQARGSAHGILAELNWSIIGTELKRLFTTGFLSRTPNGVAVTDFRSLSDFKDGRNVWIDQADSYIQFLEQKSGMQISWNSMLTGLKQIYNPETGFGDASRAEDVLRAIAHIDVFYARVLILIKQELHITMGVVSPEDIGAYGWLRISQAAENLRKKLQELSQHTKDAATTRIIEGLATYFNHKTKETEVRWVEFSDNRCAFILRSVELSQAFRQSTAQKKEIILQTDVSNQLLQGYFIQRVGLVGETIRTPGPAYGSAVENKLTVVDDGIELEVSRRLAGIQNGIVIFPTLERLKEYYDIHYSKLTSAPAVVAVGIHGGVNKVLRNFGHSKKTIVLAALPSLASFTALPLDLSHILYAGLPYVDLRHPYQSRLAKEYFPSVESYQQHIQLLCFIQSLRAFDVERITALELLITESEKQTGQFIFREMFSGQNE